MLVYRTREISKLNLYFDVSDYISITFEFHWNLIKFIYYLIVFPPPCIKSIIHLPCWIIMFYAIQNF